MAKMIELNDKFTAALAVCTGAYGNDPERSEKLKADGYNPTEIQNIVNEIFPAIKNYL